MQSAIIKLKMKTYLVLKPLVLTRKGEGFVLKSLLWKYPEEEGNAIKEQHV